MEIRTLLRATAGAALVLLCIGLAVQLVTALREAQHLRIDLAELHDVRYGLLDADQWVLRVSAVLERRIANFELDDDNRPQIKAAIEQALHAVVDQVEAYLAERARPRSESWVDRLRGGLRRGLTGILLDFEEIRRRIPYYADLLLDELSRPDTRRELGRQLTAFLTEASQSTFARTDRTGLRSVLARHGCDDVPACSQLLEARIATLADFTRTRLAALAAASTVLLALCCLPAVRRRKDAGRPDLVDLTLLLSLAFTLLAAGLLTPMIEIEARIGELSLVLLGEPVTFENQVLYFQSKSIVDVVTLLVETGAPDMILVGALVALFSIVFPALKGLATLPYHAAATGGRRPPALVEFFALKSGKWSMADVYVVAIFMAFVGFDGLLSNQLGRLDAQSETVSVITTNGTHLAPGFFLFLGFVFTGFVISMRLERDAPLT